MLSFLSFLKQLYSGCTNVVILILTNVVIFVPNLFSFLCLYFSSSPEAASTMDLAMGFLRGSDGKDTACNAGDPGSIPGSGRSPGEGNGNPLQYSCLENPVDKGAWGAESLGLQRIRHD